VSGTNDSIVYSFTPKFMVQCVSDSVLNGNTARLHRAIYRCLLPHPSDGHLLLLMLQLLPSPADGADEDKLDDRPAATGRKWRFTLLALQISCAFLFVPFLSLKTMCHACIACASHHATTEVISLHTERNTCRNNTICHITRAKKKYQLSW